MHAPRTARSSHQAHVLLDLEEELGDAEVRQAELGGQEVAVRLHVGRRRVAGGMGGDADREAADRPGQLHELDGVEELAGPGRRVGRGVAPQGHEVLHARLAERHQDLGELQPGVGHADEVGHRGEGGGAQHAGHQVVGALARLPPAPVGDRHERGRQGLELAQGADQGGLLGVVLGREELEGVGGTPLEHLRDQGHDQAIVVSGPVLSPGPARGRWSGVHDVSKVEEVVEAPPETEEALRRRPPEPAGSPQFPGAPGPPRPASTSSWVPRPNSRVRPRTARRTGRCAPAAASATYRKRTPGVVSTDAARTSPSALQGSRVGVRRCARRRAPRCAGAWPGSSGPRRRSGA